MHAAKLRFVQKAVSQDRPSSVRRGSRRLAVFQRYDQGPDIGRHNQSAPIFRRHPSHASHTQYLFAASILIHLKHDICQTRADSVEAGMTGGRKVLMCVCLNRHSVTASENPGGGDDSLDSIGLVSENTALDAGIFITDVIVRATVRID